MRLSPNDPADTMVSAGSSASGADAVARRRRSRYAVVLAALVAAVLVRALVVESYYVPDRGMEPTLRAGDRVLVGKWPGEPRKGDVVAAVVTDAFPLEPRVGPAAQGLIATTLGRAASALGIRPGDRSVVARVVATSGDHVGCSPDDGLVIAGEPVKPAVACDAFALTVPDGSVWLLGDSPRFALDSLSQARTEGHGLVPVSAVVGTVTLRLWPLGLLPADLRQGGAR